MDAAASRAESKAGRPLIPPNYVSLRHLQGLRLKEKEEQRQRQRDEEIAATRVREEQQQRDKEAAARRIKEEETAARRVREEQQQREKEAAERRVREEQQQREKEATARRVREEQQQREKEAAERMVKEEEAAAVPKPERKTSSNNSFRHKDRSRREQRFVVVGPRTPPPHRDGTVKKKKDVGAEAGYPGEEGPGGKWANKLNGGGRTAENKGKEKVPEDRKGELGEPAIAPPRPQKPEEKRKIEALGDQGTTSGTGNTPAEEKRKVVILGDQDTSSGTSNAPSESAEVSISSSRTSVRTEYLLEGKKGSGGWSTTDMTRKPDDAPPAQGIKSANKGKKKALEGRCTDVTPISDFPEGKRLQPPTTTGMNRRRHRCQRINLEKKSEVRGKKQPVVEVKAHARLSAEGISTSRSDAGQGINPEAKPEELEKKQTMEEVKTQGSSNQRNSKGQGTTQEAKSEGLGEKRAVVMTRPTVWRMPRDARSSGWQRSGDHQGNGAAWQHDMVWIPKPVVVPDNTEVE